jgi:hypothetical protein
MLTKILAALVAAVGIGASGLYLASSTGSIDCPLAGTPECPLAIAKSCCASAVADTVEYCPAGCKICDKCFTGVICCDPPAACCGVDATALAKAAFAGSYTMGMDCCFEGSPCCFKGSPCCEK